MTSTVILSDNGVSSGSAGLKNTAGNDGKLLLQTTTAGGAATTAVTIDNSQNVGIGTSSPSANLDISSSNGSNLRFTSTTTTQVEDANTGYISFYQSDTSGSGAGTGTTAKIAAVSSKWYNSGTYQPYFGTAARLGFFVNSDQASSSLIEALSIVNGGNVGVGTTSPSNRLHVAGTAATLGFFNRTSTSSGFSIGADSGGAVLQPYGVDAIQFYNAAGSTLNAKIDSSGRMGIGYNSPNAQLVVGGQGAGGWVSGGRNTLQLRNQNSSSNQSNNIVFGSAANDAYCSIMNDINANGTTVNQLNVFAGSGGGVYLANGGTSWTAVSDERYKDIIEPITDASLKVSTLRAVIGKYKTDTDEIRRSFLIAQDVQAVLPEAVTVGEDTEGNEQIGLSYSDVMPLLVAAIKEQQALITTLTERITALEGAQA